MGKRRGAMRYQRPTNPSAWEPYSPQPPSYPPDALPPSTPQLPLPIRYEQRVLWFFTWSYALFCICFIIGYTIGNSFFLSLGMSIFIGFAVSILILDARNAVSLQGWVHWNRMSRKRKILLAALFFFMMSLLAIPYLWRTHLVYRQNRALLVNRKARTALIVGLLVTAITCFIGATGD